MTDKNFTTKEIEALRKVHVSDEASAGLQESISDDNSSLDLELALHGLRNIIDRPEGEIDEHEYREAIGSVMPVVEDFRDYLEAHHENHYVPIDIKPETVLDTRNKIVELIKQKGTEAPTSIGLGWRKSVYGKAFNDKFMARGVEIWYPGVTNPTPDSAIDNPVHIKLIEDPDVTHEPRHISLTRHGRASTSVNTMDNDPDTEAWLEIVEGIEPGEWQTLLETTLAQLEAN